MLQRIRRHVPLVAPTCLGHEGTNVFSMALESKGFGYSEERTTLLELRMKRDDWLMLAGAALLTIAAYSLSGSVAYGAALLS